MPENSTFSPMTLNYLATQFGELDSDSLDITQLAIALKNQIIPTLQADSATQRAIDTIRALVYDPVTRPTSTVLEIKRILNNNESSNPDKLKLIKEIIDHALHNPPNVKIWFLTLHPRHQDSTELYKNIHSLLSDGKLWCQKQTYSQAFPHP